MTWFDAFPTAKVGDYTMLVESPSIDFLLSLGYEAGRSVGGGQGPLTYWRKA
jgi:hypothetical protein